MKRAVVSSRNPRRFRLERVQNFGSFHSTIQDDLDLRLQNNCEYFLYMISIILTNPHKIKSNQMNGPYYSTQITIRPAFE